MRGVLEQQSGRNGQTIAHYRGQRIDYQTLASQNAMQIREG
jgi:hypothetical protein